MKALAITLIATATALTASAGSFVAVGGAAAGCFFGTEAVAAGADFAATATVYHGAMPVSSAIAAGVRDVAVPDSDTDAPEVIYDLGGRRMPEGAELAPGVYMVRRGDSVTKKIIR